MENYFIKKIIGISTLGLVFFVGAGCTNTKRLVTPPPEVKTPIVPTTIQQPEKKLPPLLPSKQPTVSPNITRPAAPITPPRHTEIFNQGETIIAAWHGGDHWYLGKIVTAAPDGFKILYTDGDTEIIVNTNRLAHFGKPAKNLVVGEKILARWTNGEFYYGGISEITNEKINVTFYDGTMVVVDLKQIAVPGV